MFFFEFPEQVLRKNVIKNLDHLVLVKHLGLIHVELVRRLAHLDAGRRLRNRVPRRSTQSLHVDHRVLAEHKKCS